MSSLKSKSIYLATNNTKLHEFYLEFVVVYLRIRELFRSKSVLT